MIASLFALVSFLFLLYIKYRFHIQFALLVRRAYKYIQSKKEDNTHD